MIMRITWGKVQPVTLLPRPGVLRERPLRVRAARTRR